MNVIKYKNVIYLFVNSYVQFLQKVNERYCETKKRKAKYCSL